MGTKVSAKVLRKTSLRQFQGRCYGRMADELNRAALKEGKANHEELAGDLDRAAAALTRAAQICSELAAKGV